jgi:hypothetical protein
MKQVIARLAKIAFTFVVMNYAAVAGLIVAARGRKVWRDPAETATHDTHGATSLPRRRVARTLGGVPWNG